MTNTKFSLSAFARRAARRHAVKLAIVLGSLLVAATAYAYTDFPHINSNNGDALWYAAGFPNNTSNEMQALRGFAMSMHSGTNKRYWTCRKDPNVSPALFKCVHDPLPTSGARWLALTDCTTNDGHPEPNRYDKRCRLIIGTSATEGYTDGFMLLKASTEHHDYYGVNGSNNPNWNHLKATVFTNANIFRRW